MSNRSLSTGRGKRRQFIGIPARQILVVPEPEPEFQGYSLEEEEIRRLHAVAAGLRAKLEESEIRAIALESELRGTRLEALQVEKRLEVVWEAFIRFGGDYAKAIKTLGVEILPVLESGGGNDVVTRLTQGVIALESGKLAEAAEEVVKAKRELEGKVGVLEEDKTATVRKLEVVCWKLQKFAVDYAKIFKRLGATPLNVLEDDEDDVVTRIQKVMTTLDGGKLEGVVSGMMEAKAEVEKVNEELQSKVSGFEVDKATMEGKLDVVWRLVQKFVGEYTEILEKVQMSPPRFECGDNCVISAIGMQLVTLGTVNLKGKVEELLETKVKLEEILQKTKEELEDQSGQLRNKVRDLEEEKNVQHGRLEGVLGSLREFVTNYATILELLKVTPPSAEDCGGDMVGEIEKTILGVMETWECFKGKVETLLGSNGRLETELRKLEATQSTTPSESLSRKPKLRGPPQNTTSVTHKVDRGKRGNVCVCGSRFVSKKGLEKHLHYESLEKRFKCGYCEKQFYFRCHLLSHRQRDHNARVVIKRKKHFACHLCSEEFSSSLELWAHRIVHTPTKAKLRLESKPSTSKSTPSPPRGTPPGKKASPTRKLETLSPPKVHGVNTKKGRGSPHLCLCSKQFATSKTLLEHIRYTTSEKKFSCRRCGRRYFYARYLTRHIAQTHGKVTLKDERTTFGCTRCGRKLGTMMLLRRHCRRFHGSATKPVSAKLKKAKGSTGKAVKIAKKTAKKQLVN